MQDAQGQLTDIDMICCYGKAPKAVMSLHSVSWQASISAPARVTQQTATLLALQHAPMFLQAREGTLQTGAGRRTEGCACSVERKAREAEQMEAWVVALAAGNAHQRSRHNGRNCCTRRTNSRSPSRRWSPRLIAPACRQCICWHGRKGHSSTTLCITTGFTCYVPEGTAFPADPRTEPALP